MTIPYIAKYDVDGDGFISAADAQAVYARNGCTAGGAANAGGFTYQAKYDMNGDSRIDLVDAYTVFDYFNGATPIATVPNSSTIWNTLIPNGKTYTAGQIANNGQSVRYDIAYFSVDSSFPVKTLTGQDVTNGQQRSIAVYCDPNMSADGSLNGCCRFLCTDGSLIEGQPLKLSAGGNPSCTYLRPLAANQIQGAHGGSGLSCGGTLRKGWETGPINHVIGLNIAGWRWLNPSPSFVSPALHADRYWNCTTSNCHAYAGTGPIHMGSLLALKASDDISMITDPKTLLVANALISYGALICDDSWDDVFAPHLETGAAQMGSDSQFRTIMSKLWVVT